MRLYVRRELIDVWVDRNGPDGLVKLAQKAGVSSSLMNKVRAGSVPKKASSRLAIARALDVCEDVVFPSVTADGKAS